MVGFTPLTSTELKSEHRSKLNAMLSELYDVIKGSGSTTVGPDTPMPEHTIDGMSYIVGTPGTIWGLANCKKGNIIMDDGISFELVGATGNYIPLSYINPGNFDINLIAQ